VILSNELQLELELINRWNSLYPIYFDARVSVAKGRRVPREYALWWPQAQHLSIACRNLGLQSCLEVSDVSRDEGEGEGEMLECRKRADNPQAK
jgi:signal recognition particle subunit SRP19